MTATLTNRVARLESGMGVGIEHWTEAQVDARIAELEPRLRADLERSGLVCGDLSAADLLPALKRLLDAENNQRKSE